MLNRYKLTHFTHDDERRHYYASGADIAEVIAEFRRQPHTEGLEVLAVERIPFDDILIDGIVDHAFNAALKVIQDALRITTGDRAAHWWQGKPERDVKDLLRTYARAELRCTNSDGHVFGEQPCEECGGNGIIASTKSSACCGVCDGTGRAQ